MMYLSISGSQQGGVYLPPGKFWQCLETILVITAGGLLLASGWQRTGTPLNISQWTEQKILFLRVNSAELKRVDTHAHMDS